MAKFVFEKDFENLVKKCDGDEDLAMDVVVSILESKQKHRSRSVNKELSLLMKEKAKSNDIMDCAKIEPLIADSDDDCFFECDRVDEGLLYETLILMSILTDREKYVLYYRFFRDYTFEKIGRRLDVAGETIRQIEAKALRKLRHPSRNRHLRDYAYSNFEKDGKEIDYDHASIDDFFKLMEIAQNYRDTKKKAIKRIFKEPVEEKHDHKVSGISKFCKNMDNYLVNRQIKTIDNTRTDPNNSSKCDHYKIIEIRRNVFADVDKFVDSLWIDPIPDILKRSIKLALLEIRDRYKNRLGNARDFIRLLYYHDCDFYGGYDTLKDVIRLIIPFTQNYKTYTEDFNNKDGGWIEYYAYRLKNNFSVESIPYHNMPKELYHIITVPAYIEWYKTNGPVFSDEDDLVLFSLYNDIDNIYYDTTSLIGYISNKYYDGLDIWSFGIYDDECNNQIDLNQLYGEIDQSYTRDYFKFPIVHKGVKLTSEEIKKNAWNYVNIKGPVVLHKSIYPSIYTRTAMLGYYRSMLFLHSIDYVNFEKKFGIPIEYISDNSSLFDIEGKKKIAMISSVLIWAYNNIFIKFYEDDFWSLYNSHNCENRIDNIVSVVKNAMRHMYDEDVLNDTIKIINSII